MGVHPLRRTEGIRVADDLYIPQAELTVKDDKAVGTLEEIRDIGMDPARVGCCARRNTAEKIKGCAWFKHCRFRQWRDQTNGLRGPLNIGVEIILSQQQGGAWNQSEMACHMFYDSGAAARAMESQKSGEIVRVIAYEGDGKLLKIRETRRKNPNNADDKTMEQYIVERPVQKFVRPKERFPIIAAAEVARDEMRDEQEREALARALALNTAEQSAPVGEGRKVKRGADA